MNEDNIFHRICALFIPAIGSPSQKDWFTSGGEGWRHLRRGSWKRRRNATEKGEEGRCKRPPGLFILTVVWHRWWKKESGLRKRRPPVFAIFASHSVWGFGSQSQVSSWKAGLCLLQQKMHFYFAVNKCIPIFVDLSGLPNSNEPVHCADFWEMVCSGLRMIVCTGQTFERWFAEDWLSGNRPFQIWARGLISNLDKNVTSTQGQNATIWWFRAGQPSTAQKVLVQQTIKYSNPQSAWWYIAKIWELTWIYF